MKLSPTLCSSIVVLAALAMSADNAFGHQGKTINDPFRPCPPAGGGDPLKGLNVNRPGKKPCAAGASPTVVQGPDGKAHCTVSDKACTKEDIAQINRALTDGSTAANPATTKGGYMPKSNIKAVALGADGTLTCETKDGKQQTCSAAHIADLNSAASATSGVAAGRGDIKKKPN